MTPDRSYIGYLGFLGIDLFKSVLMYSNGAICLIKLLFDLGLFTVYAGVDYITSHYVHSRLESTPTHLPWALGNPMSESTLTLCLLYPPVRDFGFSL